MDAIIKALLSGAEDDQILKMLAELEGDQESEPDQSRPGYVSCVRVAGEPILPPVMTDHDQTRLEALTWRRKDVSCGDERRLNNLVHS